MSFFKGIGKMIKKNVNLKTLVKVTTKAASFIPVVGGEVNAVMQGFTDAHQAKKEQRESDAQIALDNTAKNFGIVAGKTAGTFVNKAMASSSQAFQESTGQAGASVIDFSIKEWLKKHKHTLILAGFLLLSAIVLVPKFFNKRSVPALKRNYRR
jgi:hypothetical protein